jgi:prophage antirepressor-like protein
MNSSNSPNSSLINQLNFIFENNKIRVIMDKNDNPWFVAKDVCDCLKLKRPNDAYSRIDEDEKDDAVLNDHLGKKQTMIIINESGLYSLILSSKKKETKIFKRWITHDVIPSIRKNGVYMTDKSINDLKENPNKLENLLKDLEEHRKNEKQNILKIKELEESNEKMKRDNLRIQRVNEELIDRQKHKEKNQNIYITSTLSNAKIGLYKIGKNNTTMKNRINNLNTSHPIGDEMVELLCVKTYNSSSLEMLIHKCLDPLRASKDREFFHAPFSLLQRFILNVADNHELAYEFANEIIELSNCIMNKNDTIDWMEGLNTNIFNKKCITIDISNGENIDTININRNESDKEIFDKVNKLLIKYISKLKNIDESEVKINETANDLIIDWRNFQLFIKNNVNNKIAIKPHKNAFINILGSANVKYILRHT